MRSSIVAHRLENSLPGLLDGEIVRMCLSCRLFVDDHGQIDRKRYSAEFLARYDNAPAELKCKHDLPEPCPTCGRPMPATKPAAGGAE